MLCYSVWQCYSNLDLSGGSYYRCDRFTMAKPFARTNNLEFINSSSLVASSSPVTIRSPCLCSTGMAIQMIFTNVARFTNCSAYSEQTTMGFPATTASITESHPQ